MPELFALDGANHQYQSTSNTRSSQKEEETGEKNRRNEKEKQRRTQDFRIVRILATSRTFFSLLLSRVSNDMSKERKGKESRIGLEKRVTSSKALQSVVRRGEEKRVWRGELKYARKVVSNGGYDVPWLPAAGDRYSLSLSLLFSLFLALCHILTSFSLSLSCARERVRNNLPAVEQSITRTTKV